MRLPKPFYRLPVRFDAERMALEIRSMPSDAWAPHPDAIPGNSSVRLISVEGGANDAVDGVMRLTPHLERSPYLRQVLASLGTVWSRSRLLRLAPQARVPPHADINYHWFYRVRLHVPIITWPEVRFFCGDESVHMAAGEAWIFDNWRQHSVENPTDDERIHLVADTSGTATFWGLVEQGERAGCATQAHRFDPARLSSVLTERTTRRPVMSAAEMDLLLTDLSTEVAAIDTVPEGSIRAHRYLGLLQFMAREWRQLYVLFGEDPEGWGRFQELRDHVRATSRSLAEGLVVRSNRVALHAVLEARVLRACLALPEVMPPAARQSTAAPAVHTAPATTPVTLDRPVFIVAAPRSGSTLLFETLAVSPSLCTLGGEAHWLVEGIPELRPGAPGVDSNRLEAGHVTAAIEETIRATLLARALDSSGQPARAASIRVLEKTPKNALRIPLLERIFPDARFIFLWRDPRENISSIMQAWRAGRWRTYPMLEGFELPWSLLLPPGWQELRGRPLSQIAAFQWECTNRMAMDDLSRIARARWTSLHYEELVSDPATMLHRLCRFCEIDFDATLAARVSAPLPPARYTLDAPRPDKWKVNERDIEEVMPDVTDTWRRLQSL